MSQLTLGAAAVVLFVLVGRTFVAYVGKRVAEDRVQRAEEIARLMKVWEERLSDQREVSRSWEASTRSLQQTVDELSGQLGTLLPGVSTMVRIVEAIREEQLRR